MKYNVPHTMKVYKIKRNLKMTLDRYIDVCLIEPYADKDIERGFSLDIDTIPEHERDNFLDMIMKEDTTLRDLVLFHMQQLINSRLPECESNDREAKGLRTIRLSNGDTYLTSKGAFA